MPKKQSMAADTGNGHDEAVLTADTEVDVGPVEATEGGTEVVAGVATVGIICVGAALFEAALIPGIVVGVAAMLVPKALPRLGTAISPMVRGAVRGTYKLGQKARHIMSEAEEQVRDIVAEENAAEVPAKPNP
jgi:hypothetical protein